MSVNSGKQVLIGELMRQGDLQAPDLSNGIAVSDNKLINACYRMTSVQKRIFNLAIAACHSKKFVAGEVVFNIEDFAQLSGKTFKESLRICRTEARGMSKLQVIDIEYKEKRSKKSLKQFVAADQREDSSREIARTSYKNFFQDVEFIDDGDLRCMYFKFSDWLVPYVELIRKKFSQIPLTDVSKLTSFYSLRLFDFLMATVETKGQRKRVFSYQELRPVIGLVDDKQGMYSAWCDFRKRCLVEPIKELNKKTDYTWDYEVKGRGDNSRKIIITAKRDDQMKLDLNED